VTFRVVHWTILGRIWIQFFLQMTTVQVVWNHVKISCMHLINISNHSECGFAGIVSVGNFKLVNYCCITMMDKEVTRIIFSAEACGSSEQILYLCFALI